MLRISYRVNFSDIMYGLKKREKQVENICPLNRYKNLYLVHWVDYRPCSINEGQTGLKLVLSWSCQYQSSCSEGYYIIQNYI